MIHVFHTPTGWKVCQEYPEKPDYPCLDCTTMDCDAAKCTEKYNEAVALSIANAVDIREEDLHHLWNSNWFFNGQPHGHDYKDNEVYALPELEIRTDKCSTCDGHGQLSRPPFDDSGECPICKGSGQLAHVFRKKEESKMEESQDELWQMIQDEMVEDFKWPKDLLELLKSKFHLTRVKAELKGEKK